MKKTIFTLAFMSLLSFVSTAQDEKGAKHPAKKETVNPDGTLSPVPAQVTPAPTEARTDNSTAPKKEGTRMAITEKGVPASKKPVEKKTEAAKTEKTEKAEKH